MNQVFPPHKSSLGLDANLTVLLLFLLPAILGFIPVVQFVAFLVPIVLYFIEKESLLVKFYALQYIFLMVASAILCVVMILLMFIPVIRVVAIIIMAVIGVIMLVFWVICLINGWKWTVYEIPIVGAYAAKYTLNATPPAQ